MRTIQFYFIGMMGIFAVVVLSIALLSSKGGEYPLIVAGQNVEPEFVEDGQIAPVCAREDLSCDEQEGAPGDSVIIGRLRSSSMLADSGDPLRYGPLNLIDNDLDSTWAEGVNEEGFGEWVEVEFANPEFIHSMRVWGGFFSKNYLLANNRLKEFEVWLDGRILRRVLVPDEGSPIDVELPIDKKIRSIRIVIIEVHNGQRWDDTCISDIAFYRDQTRLTATLTQGAFEYSAEGKNIRPSAVQLYNAIDRVAGARGTVQYQKTKTLVTVKYLMSQFSVENRTYNDQGQLLKRAVSYNIKSGGGGPWYFMYNAAGNIATVIEHTEGEPPYDRSKAVYEYEDGVVKAIRHSYADNRWSEVFSYINYTGSTNGGSPAQGWKASAIFRYSEELKFINDDPRSPGWSTKRLVRTERRSPEGIVFGGVDYEYDAQGRLQREITDAGDSDGRTTLYSYSRDGKLSELHFSGNTYRPTYYTYYTYDEKGGLARGFFYRDPLRLRMQNITSYRYNDEGSISAVYEYSVNNYATQKSTKELSASLYDLFIDEGNLDAGWTVVAERDIRGVVTRKIVTNAAGIVERVLVYEYETRQLSSMAVQ